MERVDVVDSEHIATAAKDLLRAHGDDFRGHGAVGVARGYFEDLACPSHVQTLLRCAKSGRNFRGCGGGSVYRMAQQLWLLRHGEAEPHGERPDDLRELTDRGERQSRAAGAALRALEVRLDAVLCSPRVRALDTARLACEVYGNGLHADVYEPLSTGFDAADALELVAARGPDVHLMVVGHEPTLGKVIAELTGAPVKLKKGGVATVDVTGAAALLGQMAAEGSGSDMGTRYDSHGGHAGELVLLARPRELAHIAGMALSEV
jgi:phosphohistidine phosphatase